MLNQLLLRSKQWLRIYEVGQVWETLTIDKITITKVTPKWVEFKSFGSRGTVTKGIAKTWLKKLLKG